MKRRQLMIEPPTEKPDPKHQRRINTRETFHKVGAVLLGNPMGARGPQTAQSLGRNRIKIADHHVRLMSVSHQPIRATVRSNNPPIQPGHRLKPRFALLSAPNQQNWFRIVNNGSFHPIFTLLKETHHNIDTK